MQVSSIVIALLVILTLVAWTPHIRVSTGDSMAPGIPSGTNLVICDPVRNVTESIEEGDIVSWEHGNGWLTRTSVLHRVIAMDSQTRLIHTKGDNTSIRDHPVPYEAVNCEYIHHVHIMDLPLPRFQPSDIPEPFLEAYL